MLRDARALLNNEISEKDFQSQVVALAKIHGYCCYHTFDSRRSAHGFPDLVMVHETDSSRPIIIMELKTERGKATPAQLFWLERLDCGEALEDYIVAGLFRPSDLDRIEALLQGRGDWRTV